MIPDIYEFYKNVTMKWEKGKVNDVNDPGGATNDGVATHFITDFASTTAGVQCLHSLNIEPDFIMGYMNKQAKTKTRIFNPDLLMSFTPDQCMNILIFNFWTNNQLPNVGPKLAAYATFDFCINSGASRGKKYLQMAANDFTSSRAPLAIDGIFGPKSYERFNDFTNPQDDIALALRVCDKRLSFLRSLNTWQYYGRGWQNRVDALRSYIQSVGARNV